MAAFLLFWVGRLGTYPTTSALRVRGLGIGGFVPSDAYDAGYWLERAFEARRQAEEMTHPPAKREMLLIAAGYELLAQHAEERSRRPQVTWVRRSRS